LIICLKASSLAVELQISIRQRTVAFDIIEKVKQNIDLVKEHPEVLWLNMPTNYSKKEFQCRSKQFDKNFMGIIQGVSALKASF
jgi:hypothetical protein